MSEEKRLNVCGAWAISPTMIIIIGSDWEDNTDKPTSSLPVVDKLFVNEKIKPDLIFFVDSPKTIN